jgi:hypothetical protein
VTDKTLVINPKGVKSKEVDNFLNIWFHSNHNTPIQISATDRRYSVFPTSDKKLIDIIDIPIEEFIYNVQDESDDFIQALIGLEVDYQDIAQPLRTKEKILIAESTTSKLEHIGGLLKSGNLDELVSILEEIEADNELIENLKENFYNGYITNFVLKPLYKLLISDNATSREIGIKINSFLGKTKQKKVNGQVIRVRDLPRIERPLSKHDEYVLHSFKDYSNEDIKAMLEGKEVSLYSDDMLKRVLELRG